jgi:hypothetical protein
MTIEGRTRRVEVTGEADRSRERVTAPGDTFVCRFLGNRVRETTTDRQVLSVYVEKCEAYNGEEESETEGPAVDGIEYDPESFRNAIAHASK